MTLIDSLTTTTWEALGPSPIDAVGVGLGRAAGRVEAAATVPGHPETVYAAATAASGRRRTSSPAPRAGRR
jgi:hypothetical protein